METPLWPLFVFGTLRHGRQNHHFLENRYVERIPASLPGYRRVAELMIDRDPDSSVPGELYTLDPGRYAETLAGCDGLEEIPPGQLRGQHYERRLVMVETTSGRCQAWAYVRPDFAA